MGVFEEEKGQKREKRERRRETRERRMKGENHFRDGVGGEVD